MKTRSKKLNKNLLALKSNTKKDKATIQNEEKKQRNSIQTRSKTLMQTLLQNEMDAISEVNYEDKRKQSHSKLTAKTIIKKKETNRSDRAKTRSRTLINNEMEVQSNEESELKTARITLDGKKLKLGGHSDSLIEFNGDYRIFIVGDLVWAKLKGWPAWPAKVNIPVQNDLSFLELNLSCFKIKLSITDH